MYYKITFRHHDKLYASVLVSKSEFINAGFINLPCNTIEFRKNKYKNATDRYDFFILEDTIINQKKYAAYKLKSIRNLKQRIRKSSGTNLYIIDNTTNFHLPILTHPTAYEEWKIKKNLPNGMFVEKKHINVYEKEHSSEKLISYDKVDRKIVISNDCYNSN